MRQYFRKQFTVKHYKAILRQQLHQTVALYIYFDTDILKRVVIAMIL